MSPKLSDVVRCSVQLSSLILRMVVSLNEVLRLMIVVQFSALLEIWLWISYCLLMMYIRVWP